MVVVVVVVDVVVVEVRVVVDDAVVVELEVVEEVEEGTVVLDEAELDVETAVVEEVVCALVCGDAA